ncbi:hypothetical protein [Desulfovibrio aminophilus]|uniref:hypothetical protein n=1 Tax=Desulfovibrio aminophilus TaxID=81425 RepID=UPI00048399C3|nr:hypothetical protein [Desulfovibrio aminophilus]
MTNTIKIIKTEAANNKALKRIEHLMGTARPGTPEGDELELLTTLVELYEKENAPILPPSPVEAIRFRMDQMDLTNRDLVPILGSKSRVSEVLSGKRPLTLSMIRALRKHLDIPADVLVDSPEELPQEPTGIQWENYPLKELVHRGWFQGLKRWKKEFSAQAEEWMRDLHERAGGGPFCAPAACFRKGSRRNAKADSYALHAWILCVKAKATQILREHRSELGTFERNRLDDDFFREIVRLSVQENGPKVAQNLLKVYGILLVIVPHFDKTYLDGAAMLLEDGTPVIGLTLRHDRIDNFWFCLLHELAHVREHLHPDNTDLVLDDLDIHVDDDGIEKQADMIAREAELPADVWKKSKAYQLPTAQNVRSLAKAQKIHPAIVAGRARFEIKNYRMLSKLVGFKTVRELFAKEMQGPSGH